MYTRICKRPNLFVKSDHELLTSFLCGINVTIATPLIQKNKAKKYQLTNFSIHTRP